MNKLEVTCFGRLCVSFAGEELRDIAVHKVQELFCYLLLYRQHAHHRDKLATVLWGDSPTTQAKAYLRKALWQMRQAFDTVTAAADCPVLLANADWLQFNPDFPLHCDIAIFERAYAQIKSFSPPGLSAAQKRAVEEAVHLYQGDFLEGWYQDWCLYERERLEFNYLSMLDKLSHQCEHEQLYEEGIAYGQMILHHDAAREQTHFRLMRLFYLAGQRTNALRQYEQCADILREELGVEPSQRTKALHKAIEADNLLEIIASNSIKPYRPPSPQKTLQHLQSLHQMLDQMRLRIQKEMQVVRKEL